MWEVVFINQKGERVSKFFDSIIQCRKFVYKLQHSKKLLLCRYPNEIYI